MDQRPSKTPGELFWRGRRAGFTLTELVVVVFLTSIGVGGLLMIYDRSTSGAMVQQQYLDTQRTLRTAMRQIKGDMRLASYLATPDSALDTNVCNQILDGSGTEYFLRAVTFQRDDGFVMLDTINVNIEPSSVILLGNFAHGTGADDQQVFRTLSISGNQVTLEDNGSLPSDDEWDDYFGVTRGPNRFLKITNSEQYDLIYTIEGANSTTDTITLGQSVPTVTPPAACGLQGFGSGYDVNVMYHIRYRIAPDPRLAVADAHPVLLREELEFYDNGTDAPTPIDETVTIIAEHVVDMQFYDFVFDIDTTGTTPDLNHAPLISSVPTRTPTITTPVVATDGTGLLGDNGDSLAEPENIRAVTVKLTACDAEHDFDLDFEPRASTTAPITTYRTATNLAGASRCISAASRVWMESLSAINLKP